MKKKIAIIDYGLGNLFSVEQACSHLGVEAKITSCANEIENADGLILPGVGAFGVAMENLKKNNLVNPLLQFAKSGKPFIGICLGMQLMFTESEEFGQHKGLNLIEGIVRKFPKQNKEGINNIIPQIQWNTIHNKKKSVNPILNNLEDGSFMYFVHSYYCQPKDDNLIYMETNYSGINYTSIVIKNNIIGIQFHPEKSAQKGLDIYRSIIKLM